MKTTTGVCSFLADNTPYLNSTSINICPVLSNQILLPQISLDSGEKTLKEVLGTREVHAIIDQIQAEDKKPSEMSWAELDAHIRNLDINQLSDSEFEQTFLDTKRNSLEENRRRFSLLNATQKQDTPHKLVHSILSDLAELLSTFVDGVLHG